MIQYYIWLDDEDEIPVVSDRCTFESHGFILTGSEDKPGAWVAYPRERVRRVERRESE